MRILIVCDVGLLQLTGVSRTYESLIPELERLGHQIKFISPDDFPVTCSFPLYKESQLVILPYRRLKEMGDAFSPDIVHIATEGPLGFSAQKYCRKAKLPFNTFCHTNLPDYSSVYLGKFLPIPNKYIRSIVIWIMRRFHAAASCNIIATQSYEDLLKSWQFKGPLRRLQLGVLMNFLI